MPETTSVYYYRLHNNQLLRNVLSPLIRDYFSTLGPREADTNSRSFFIPRGVYPIPVRVLTPHFDPPHFLCDVMRYHHLKAQRALLAISREDTHG
jgi:hypothetical protein